MKIKLNKNECQILSDIIKKKTIHSVLYTLESRDIATIASYNDKKLVENFYIKIGKKVGYQKAFTNTVTFLNKKVFKMLKEGIKHTRKLIHNKCNKEATVYIENLSKNVKHHKSLIRKIENVLKDK